MQLLWCKNWKVLPLVSATCKPRSNVFLPQVLVGYWLCSSPANIQLYAGKQNRYGTSEDSLAFISFLYIPKSYCFIGRVKGGVFTFFFFQFCLYYLYIGYFLTLKIHIIFHTGLNNNVLHLLAVIPKWGGANLMGLTPPLDIPGECPWNTALSLGRWCWN